MAVTSRFTKDPSARLDYAFDWSTWLGAGETISTYTVTKTGDVAIATDSQAAGIVTAWLTGGTAGTQARLTCHITTSANRQDDRSITIDIRDR